MEPALARVVWHHLEAVNAVTYFAAECRQAPADLGLRGFWMGYFAARAAPLGAVDAGTVEATFYNFAPAMVRRAIPDAWSYTTPSRIIDSRSTAAAAAIRRSHPDVDRAAVEVNTVLRSCVAQVERDAPGRPLFAGNLAVGEPSDPVACLWQLATTLREHRGDGHIALLTTSEIDGCEAHVLFAASGETDADLLRQARGWDEAAWDAAAERLRGRGLLDRAGSPTEAGAKLRMSLELRTDELALRAFAHLGGDGANELLSLLRPLTASIVATGEIIFPNPIGLPRPA